MKRPARVVGIDLGTTHTVVSWSRATANFEPRVFAIPQLVQPNGVDELDLLPSVLYAPHARERVADEWNDAPWVIGEFAHQHGRKVQGRLVSSAKSWLCHAAVDRHSPILPWGSQAEDVVRLSPVEASARILRHVRSAWDSAFPKYPLHEQFVVLTVPASFDQVARRLTLEAAEQAGLSVRLLEEPLAAFYAYWRNHADRVFKPRKGRRKVLVCDVGGGTTDLSLIEVQPKRGGPQAKRSSVGRHLLLGGDNMDLAIAHLAEKKFGGKLDPARFDQLVLACRTAKEQLLGPDAPASVKVTVAGSGSQLIGSAQSVELEASEVASVAVDGFFPETRFDELPQRRASGFVGFGLPYERDPAILRHLAAFLQQHASGELPDAVLFNGGVFHSEKIRQRVADALSEWRQDPVEILHAVSHDSAVAQGAVVFGCAVLGIGERVGGGSARGYYVGLEGETPQALCVVPRGTAEGQVQRVDEHPLVLSVGQTVRFELYASDHAVHNTGELQPLDERFERVSTITTRLDRGGADEVSVSLEGELTPLGTLELACVETTNKKKQPAQRFKLEFELRQPETPSSSEDAASSPATTNLPKTSLPPAPSQAPTVSGQNDLADARDAISRVFGKTRKDVHEREVRQLTRRLESLLGERKAWDLKLARELANILIDHRTGRRRSEDHERVFWLLTGYCMRPGFGDPTDSERIATLAPLFEQGLTHSGSERTWEQFWVAWRRLAGGLSEATQTQIRAALDPWFAPEHLKLKKNKRYKPVASGEALALVSWLERVPAARRAELGKWLLERTWTDRNPQLWTAIGRLGARSPIYASAHYVVATAMAESWLEHALTERWDEMPTAAAAAYSLARVTADRSRDVPESLRLQVIARLERIDAPEAWLKALREHIPLVEADLSAQYGESLPIGLRLLTEAER